MESRWSEGQIELFHALGKICEQVGREGADELLRQDSNGTSSNALDGRGFIAELAELRKRASRVDEFEKRNKKLYDDLVKMAGKYHAELEKTNARECADIDAAREQISNKRPMRTMLEVNSEGNENRSPSAEERTISSGAEEECLEWKTRHERLMQKHNVLGNSYQELALARSQLESKLRSSQKLTREWVEYANGLEKKIGRLKGQLTRYGRSWKLRPDRDSSEVIASNTPPSSRELVPTKTGKVETLRRELPGILHMSEQVSELARSAAMDIPLHMSSCLLNELPNNQSVQGKEDFGSKDAPLPQSTDSTRLSLHLRASDTEGAILSPKLSTDETPDLHHDSETTLSPESHPLVTPEEFDDILPALPSRDQFDMPPPTIKEELLSDTPVIMFCRSIKKRKARDYTREDESNSYTKVKFELITSSPIGLAGFQSCFPQESLDLDEIGEKSNTPKKRRRPSSDSPNENRLTVYKSTPVELLQDAELLADGKNTRPNGNPLVLQPASPNKRAPLPVSGLKRDTKRRFSKHFRGSIILGEDDDENDTVRRTNSNTKMENYNNGMLTANSQELQTPLDSLLEEPCPAKELLTPIRPLVFSAATARLRDKATSSEKYGKLTPSTQLRSGANRTPNTLAVSSEPTKSSHKPSTAKKRSTRTPKDAQALAIEDLDQKPLRTRPAHRLSLEHFKVNPEFNQGSDYAFTDVVRGRELRKCLPGCTKAECCGDKFRKFVEFARAHEHQTRSQEEEDERLLEDYLGDRRSRLRNIEKEEREDLLIQARTRDLANRASKHRHAYERRRTPPGFWRSDFPNTQELQIDREEAASRERELVQQRYQEAMRPGGRWLFRDE